MSARTILLVEDSTDDALLTGRVFNQCNILNPLEVLSNGHAALEYLAGKQNLRKRAPALVLLDLTLPRFSGVDVLRALGPKRIAELGPIVILSGNTDLRIINECYKLGAKSFLTKPISAIELVNLVSMISGLRIAQGTAGLELDLA